MIESRVTGPRLLNDPEGGKRRIALRPAFRRDFGEVLRAGTATDGARVVPNHESRSENPHERYGENRTHPRLDRADAVQRGNAPLSRYSPRPAIGCRVFIGRGFAGGIWRSGRRGLGGLTPPEAHGPNCRVWRCTWGDTVPASKRPPEPMKPLLVTQPTSF